MRNKKRIVPILLKIAKVWSSNPDLRLCQLLYNAATREINSPIDLFYLEDEDLLRGLKKIK